MGLIEQHLVAVAAYPDRARVGVYLPFGDFRHAARIRQGFGISQIHLHTLHGDDVGTRLAQIRPQSAQQEGIALHHLVRAVHIVALVVNPQQALDRRLAHPVADRDQGDMQLFHRIGDQRLICVRDVARNVPQDRAITRMAGKIREMAQVPSGVWSSLRMSKRIPQI